MTRSRRDPHDPRCTLLVLLATTALAACAEPGSESADDPDAVGVTSEALCSAPEMIRIVSANMAHVNLQDDILPAGVTNPRVWLDRQVEFLDNRQLASQATVYALQETSIQNSISDDVHWPNQIASELSGTGECRQYDWVQYAPIYWLHGAGPPTNDRATDESYGTALISNAGWNYSNMMDLFDSSVGCRCVTPATGELDNMRQRATVARITEGTTELWVLSVHLTPRDMLVNRCQLNNLFAELGAIDPNIKIVVTGDFNIAPTNTADYSYMLTGFSSRGFVHVGGQGRDHMFVRDPRGELGWTFTAVPPVTSISIAQQRSEMGFEVSDHAILVLDLRLRPPTARSCRGACGGLGGPGAGALCHCDPACESFGDCCWDRDAWCPGGAMTAPADSCQSRCGGASTSGSCHCDSLCQHYGDCCADYVGWCDAGRCTLAHQSPYSPPGFPYVTLSGAGSSCACDRIGSTPGGGCAGSGRNDCCSDAQSSY